MKKNILLCLLVIMGLFVITGCGSKKEIIPGTYTAYNIVLAGIESDEEMMRENGWFITLEVNDDKTVVLSWIKTEETIDTVISFTMKDNKLVDDATGDEYSYSYHNGEVTLEAPDGTFWAFK